MFAKTGKSFAELRLSFAIDRFFDRLFSELPWIRENFFSAQSSRVLHTYDELGNRARVVLFQAPRSPDAVSVACMRTRVNSVLVLRPVDCGSMFAGAGPPPEWAGKRTLKYVSSEQEIAIGCLLHMQGDGNILSATNLLVFSFEKLWGDRKQHEPQYLLHGEHENKG